MKTILIITDNTHDQINGVVTTFRNIEQWAIKDNYKILYITPNDFRHFRAPGYPEVKISFPFGIGKRITQINPDYIHIATEGPIGLFANLWCWRNRYKFNTSYHSKWPEFMKKMYGIPEAITIFYLKRFHNHSGIVLTTTKTMVADLLKRGYRSNIIPWTRGVDFQTFNGEIRSSDRKQSPVLLNVGRVSIEKGLEDFCKLDYPGATKIIVGDGPYRSYLESKYPDVIFTGMKTGSELAEYYANSDVFVFPSVTDTFGVVIIESIACGTPVAAYPVPGPIDILQEGITGSMNCDLRLAVEVCLSIDRHTVEQHSREWTWEECWRIFRDNLVPII